VDAFVKNALGELIYLAVANVDCSAISLTVGES
jgi:hypothetical protein